MTTDTDTTPVTDLGSSPDGLPVVAVNLELRGVGGSLTPSLRVAPELFEQGATVIVSFEAVVGSLRFDPEKREEPGGDQVRVHIAHATTAVVRRAGKGQLEKQLATRRNQIGRAEDAEKGVQRLPDNTELQDAHDAGEHAAGLVDGCPACDKERELEQDGN